MCSTQTVDGHREQAGNEQTGPLLSPSQAMCTVLTCARHCTCNIHVHLHKTLGATISITLF